MTFNATWITFTLILLSMDMFSNQPIIIFQHTPLIFIKGGIHLIGALSMNRLRREILNWSEMSGSYRNLTYLMKGVGQVAPAT